MKSTESPERRNSERSSTFLVTTLLLAVVASLLLAGCSKRYDDLPAFLAFPIGDPPNESVGRFKTSYLADQVHAYFRGATNGPIAITTFVNVDNIESSSTFGRILSEQLMSELSMRGYDVLEMRQGQGMRMVEDEGEFNLSREAKALKHANPKVAAVLVGTYAVSPVRVYVNARLLDPRTSTIVSVGSVEMGKTAEIGRLLRSNSFPMALERLPVKNTKEPFPYFGYAYPYYGSHNPEAIFVPEPKGDTTDLPAPAAAEHHDDTGAHLPSGS